MSTGFLQCLYPGGFLSVRFCGVAVSVSVTVHVRWEACVRAGVRGKLSHISITQLDERKARYETRLGFKAVEVGGYVLPLPPSRISPPHAADPMRHVVCAAVQPSVVERKEGRKEGGRK